MIGRLCAVSSDAAATDDISPDTPLLMPEEEALGPLAFDIGYGSRRILLRPPHVQSPRRVGSLPFVIRCPRRTRDPWRRSDAVGDQPRQVKDVAWSVTDPSNRFHMSSTPGSL